MSFATSFVFVPFTASIFPQIAAATVSFAEPPPCLRFLRPLERFSSDKHHGYTDWRDPWQNPNSGDRCSRRRRRADQAGRSGADMARNLPVQCPSAPPMERRDSVFRTTSLQDKRDAVPGQRKREPRLLEPIRRRKPISMHKGVALRPPASCIIRAKPRRRGNRQRLKTRAAWKPSKATVRCSLTAFRSRHPGMDIVGTQPPQV